MENRLIKPLDSLGDDNTSVFIWEQQIQADRPPYDDKVVSTILGASLEVAESVPAYGRLRDRFALQQGDVPAFAVRKWAKAHIGFFGQPEIRNELGFPYAFTDEQFCVDALKEMFTNPKSPHFRQLSHNLKRPLQTSRPERRFIYAFIAGLMSRRSPYFGPVTVHDYGGSNGMVMNSLGARAYDDHSTEVVDESYSDNQCNTNLYRWIASTAEFEGGLWIEAAPPKTEADNNYIKMCSIEPQQLRTGPSDPRETYEDYYDAHSLFRSPSVELVEDDFTRMSPRNARRLAERPADLVHFSHSLSENPELAEKAIKSAISRKKPDGLIAVTGRFAIDSTNPARLIPVRTGWYSRPWVTKTHILDTRKPDQGWFLLLESEDGSGQRLRVKNEEKITKEKIFE